MISTCLFRFQGKCAKQFTQMRIGLVKYCQQDNIPSQLIKTQRESNNVLNISARVM